MVSTKRNQNIYEHIDGYEKPPVVSFPDIDNFETWARIGFKSNRTTRFIVKNISSLTGFRKFYMQLPDSIESLLRQNNMRLPGLYSPVISATLAIGDDSRNLTAAERAATLIISVRSLYKDVYAGKLKQDFYKDHPLEMGQYPNLFSTSLIVDGKKVKMYKSDDTSKIAILVAGKFYSLEVGDVAKEISFEKLVDSLNEILRIATQNRRKATEPPVGILTCASDSTQFAAFQKMRKFRMNIDSLQIMHNSFFVLCLDMDTTPSSYAEAAFMAHSNDFANRWFHSSLQAVVFGNAKAAIICNFTTYLAGNTMMRSASEIQKRAQNVVLLQNQNKKNESFYSIKTLQWQIDKKIVRQAFKDIRLVSDNQQATFEVDGFGKQFFSHLGLKPVPAFMLTLQLALKKMTGELVKTTQFLSMSKYRCMDLVTVVDTTAQDEKYIQCVEKGYKNFNEVRAIIEDAVQAKLMAYRNARRSLPISEMITLFMRSKKGVQRSIISFILMTTLFLLRVLKLFNPERRKIVVSHPKIYPEVPIVGRPGVRLPYVKYFGMHYQIMENKIVITMMPSLDWTIPNVEFISVLKQCLYQFQEIFEKGLEEKKDADDSFDKNSDCC